MSNKKNKRPDVLTLGRYLPYRLSVLSNRVSGYIAETYSDKFAITVTQWRIMAVLGEEPGIAAEEVSMKTQIEKSLVSRAIGKLLSRHMVDRKSDTTDRRRSILKLTKTGQSIYDEIVPIAYQMEQELLEGFSKSELEQFSALVDRLSLRAQELGKL